MKGTWLFAIAVAMLLEAAATQSASAEGDGTLQIESRNAQIGESVPATLRALDIPQLVGAWTIDVQYDPDVVDPVECVAYNCGVCSTAFRSDTLRVTGASATGLTGDFDLATLVFRCAEGLGRTELTITREIWGSSIPEEPPLDSKIVEGFINCEKPVVEKSSPVPTPIPQPVLPPTGSGSRGDSIPLWPFAALLAAFGCASLVAAIAARRRA
jgi:hypothetical protein